jgi:hypothetical protein
MTQDKITELARAAAQETWLKLDNEIPFERPWFIDIIAPIITRHLTAVREMIVTEMNGTIKNREEAIDNLADEGCIIKSRLTKVEEQNIQLGVEASKLREENRELVRDKEIAIEHVRESMNYLYNFRDVLCLKFGASSPMYKTLNDFLGRLTDLRMYHGGRLAERNHLRPAPDNQS